MPKLNNYLIDQYKITSYTPAHMANTKSAIKRINIVLGDEQVAAVGRAKTAKNKTAGVM